MTSFFFFFLGGVENLGLHDLYYTISWIIISLSAFKVGLWILYSHSKYD